ncbi:Universal stress protein A family protein C25B2.10 [Purpureocillium lavendulum]|uniref:Universal stress protein A family protein C25B2.10 n=1 Tax=Purpureocillium lavendulum TaxID=1247861 RepID=A0AB34FQF4_9HYPO|nr:Universal stress protein A family protein C25B2.10 [Purpureocillium lavendulum]
MVQPLATPVSACNEPTVLASLDIAASSGRVGAAPPGDNATDFALALGEDDPAFILAMEDNNDADLDLVSHNTPNPGCILHTSADTVDTPNTTQPHPVSPLLHGEEEHVHSPAPEWELAGWLNTTGGTSLQEWWDVTLAVPSHSLDEAENDISTPQVSQSPPTPDAIHFLPMVRDTSSQNSRPLLHTFGPLAANMGYNVPFDAVFLLKHYTTTVLRALTPYRHSKTPWHVLFIPHVKSCLAALTLDDHLDQASLCAFFGTLAISAFSLGGICNSSEWLQKGEAYKQEACVHLRMMLKTAYNVPKTAKYKSILMALLTMVQISILWGSRSS